MGHRFGQGPELRGRQDPILQGTSRRRGHRFVHPRVQPVRHARERVPRRLVFFGELHLLVQVRMAGNNNMKGH
jgi:hypothetical protein